MCVWGGGNAKDCRAALESVNINKQCAVVQEGDTAPGA